MDYHNETTQGPYLEKFMGTNMKKYFVIGNPIRTFVVTQTSQYGWTTNAKIRWYLLKKITLEDSED